MKRMKRIVLALLMVAMTIGMVSMTQAAVKINKTKATIEVGKSITLKITGTKDTVKWASSKKSVATVTTKGKVTGIKAGKATITATIGKKKLKSAITVEAPKLNKTDAEIKPGATLKLVVKGTKRTIKWSSSKKTVATVSAKGIVTAKKVGKTVITAKIGSTTLKCNVTVSNNYIINGVSCTPEELMTVYGEVLLLNLLKDPSSLTILKIYNGKSSVYKDKRNQSVIEYTATNSFGGVVKSYFEVNLDEFSQLAVDYGIEHYIKTKEFGYVNGFDSDRLEKPDNAKILDKEKINELAVYLNDHNDYKIY